MTRVEVGGGYSIQRNLLLKLSFQHNTRDGGRLRHGAHLAAGAAGVLVLMQMTDTKDTEGTKDTKGRGRVAARVRAVVVAPACLLALCRRRPLCPLCLCVLCARGPRSAARGNGAIRGRVELRRVPPRRSSGGPASPISARRRDATCRICGGRSSISNRRRAARSSRATAAARVMDQRNETFVPHVLAITTGTTVDFPNCDRILPQRVFALEDRRVRSRAVRDRPLASRSASIGRASCACSATSTRT